MFDLGMMELLVIGVVALIVVGPKDLPVMFREVGRFMGRMRGMARDFQRAMNEAADDTGMRDLDRDIRKMTSARKLGLDHVNEARALDGRLEHGAEGPGHRQAGRGARRGRPPNPRGRLRPGPPLGAGAGTPRPMRGPTSWPSRR